MWQLQNQKKYADQIAAGKNKYNDRIWAVEGDPL